MKKTLAVTFVCVLTIILAGVFAGGASGSIGGTSGYYKTGCLCHSSTQGPFGKVVVNGPTALKAGEKGTYTVALVGLLPGPVGGFDAAVEDQYSQKAGTMTAGQNSKVRPGGKEISHDPSATGKALNGRVWTFDWTAPSTAGAYTLYSVALAADGNGGPNPLVAGVVQDHWYKGDPFAINVTP